MSCRAADFIVFMEKHRALGHGGSPEVMIRTGTLGYFSDKSRAIDSPWSVSCREQNRISYSG